TPPAGAAFPVDSGRQSILSARAVLLTVDETQPPTILATAMQRSTARILTTHAGSLPRPGDLLDMARRPERGDAYAARVKRAVADVVREQVEHGLDVIDDGEM